MLRDAIRSLPGIGRVLPALEGLPPAHLVGGAVRDLLRGETGVDLDIAVEGEVAPVARELAARLGGDAVCHGRFDTATVSAGALSLDLAATRRERYPTPGALPMVEPAPLAEDLARRDFSINAMAAALAGDALGRLHDPHGGRADLDAGVVRVLHPRSFSDDPTRLLRAARYTARFDFALDPETEALAREAAAAGALATLTPTRAGAALLDLLAEPTAPAALGLLRDLGADRALHPSLSADPELVASAQLGSLETGADPGLAALAALASDRPAELAPWIESLGLDAAARDAVLAAARSAPLLARELRSAHSPSELHQLLAPVPPEVLALALTLGAPAEPVLRFVRDLRDARLEISGADLIAAGVPESPAIGRALDETLRRKLDGELDGREAELQAALAAVAAQEGPA